MIGIDVVDDVDVEAALVVDVVLIVVLVVVLVVVRHESTFPNLVRSVLAADRTVSSAG